MKKESKLPSDLVTLADLVHAPRESTKGSEEHEKSTRTGVRDSASKPGWSEPAGRWTVLEKRHVLNASHTWLLPYQRFRHFYLPRLFSFSFCFTFWNDADSTQFQSLCFVVFFFFFLRKFCDLCCVWGN